jgi:pimeloyl-ACP methyl ester carboxylesterase
VRRLVLVGATLPFFLKTPDNPAGVDRAAFDGLRAALATNRIKWLSDNAPPFWMPDSSPALMDWGHVMPWQCSLRAMLELTHTMSETDLRAELRALRIRTLLVHGTADRSVPIQFARATAALIEQCELREYEGAPHGLPLTHMERFNADLTEFVGG